MAIPYWIRWYLYGNARWAKWHLQGHRGRTLCGRELSRWGYQYYSPRPDVREECCQQCLAQLKARMPADD